MKGYIEPLDYNNSEVDIIPWTDPFYNTIKELDEDPEARAKFVHNLGKLLSQTRERIMGMRYYNDGVNEYAEVLYPNGYRIRVNISCDSWAAIIKDVMKEIDS